jgi:toxin ParE1/3/4
VISAEIHPVAPFGSSRGRSKGQKSLVSLADRGRVVPELGDSTLRELFVFKYRLLYRIRDDRVVIVAFLHGARDFAKWRHEQERDL